MNMDCIKLLSPSNWTIGGCRDLCHICAILLILSESLWIIWIFITELDFTLVVTFIYTVKDYLIEELETAPILSALRNILFLSTFGIILSVFTNYYALKLAMSFKVADKRCLYLFLLRVIQIIYSVWLRNRDEPTPQLLTSIGNVQFLLTSWQFCTLDGVLPNFYLPEKIMKKFVKLCLHSS